MLPPSSGNLTYLAQGEAGRKVWGAFQECLALLCFVSAFPNGVCIMVYNRWIKLFTGNHKVNTDAGFDQRVCHSPGSPAQPDTVETSR